MFKFLFLYNTANIHVGHFSTSESFWWIALSKHRICTIISNMLELLVEICALDLTVISVADFVRSMAFYSRVVLAYMTLWEGMRFWSMGSEDSVYVCQLWMGIHLLSSTCVLCAPLATLLVFCSCIACQQRLCLNNI